MDILIDFRKFFYENGFNDLIQKFRNPTEEERIFLDAKYHPESDSREWTDPQLEDTGLNPQIITPFNLRLDRELSSIKAKILERLDSLVELRNSDPTFVTKTIDVSSVNFVQLRKELTNTTDWERYQNTLLLFIAEVETIFRQKGKLLLSNKKTFNSSTTKTKGKAEHVSFKYKGNEQQLRKLYYEFHLDSGSFINYSITSFQEFKAILISADAKAEQGFIQFGCETKQACYALGKIKDLFDNLSFKLIGDSGKFKTNTGSILTANNISRAKSGEPKQKRLIDAFLRSVLNP